MNPIEDEKKARADHVDVVNHVAADATDHEEHTHTFFQAFSRTKMACAWCFYACWTIILVAFDNQAAGAVLGIPQFRKDFGYEFNGDYVIAAGWQSAFNGAPIASGVFAALFAGEIADRIGRHSSSIAPLKLRGFFGCFVGVAYGVGPLIAFIVVNYTGRTESRWAYRTVFCCQFGFAAVATILLPLMPESPWWLASKGRNSKAIKALERLGNSPEEAKGKFALVQLILEEICRESEGVTYVECFRKSNLRRTIISIMPMCIQAFSGIQFVASYFTYYLQLAGYSTGQSFRIQIAQPVLSIVGNLMAAATIGIIGVRNLTFWGLGTVAFILIYSWWYNVSIGSTAFALLSETSTSRLRVKTIAIGNAVSQSINIMWQFTIPFMFNPDKANLGAKIAFIFGGLCFFCLVYLWFYQPDTTGRSYQELDEMFTKGIPASKFKTYRTDAQVENEASTKFTRQE
ncbi:hypothetical protein KVT40_001084 [Elsinoe batatas]|uniref:Major facilitator superfamily (MFS) profile domain-containing protein n=1 Tax=Elsinoe batatas TaxID=2601811 RepID=A0A8K0LB89_9PEZI|nr:hypothetical protein KVT40_001084 [Elsinoe batatas]